MPCLAPGCRGGWPDAMTYKSVRFENIGPIESGEVRRHPVSVFIGPTGSGKSIAARVIHGVRLNAPRSQSRLDPYYGGDAGDRLATCMGDSIARGAGIPASRMPTHGARSSSLEVVSDVWGTKKIDCMKLGTVPAAEAVPPPAPGGGRMHSIYVPAGRMGIVQSYAALARAGGALRRGARGGSPSGSEAAGADHAPPEHLGPFCGAMFESLAGPPTATGARIISRVFGGALDGPADAGVEAATYEDSCGFGIEATSAASGVLSSLPVIECIESVKSGGLLVVEEPEAHLEPMRQLILVEELAKAARAAPFDLILTTHSDHMLDSVLSLVASGKMKREDLGLYYFESKDGSRSRIRRVTVNEDGTAEQDMFKDATDMLARRFI